MSTYLLCIPTYNEADNILRLLERVADLRIPGLSLLVIDDGSPDGTAELVQNWVSATGRMDWIHLLQRSHKEGLGPAYKAGFAWGVTRDFDYFIEMDADGSHQAEELPALLEASSSADLVLGTRWMSGGSVHNWPLYRRAISQIGTSYARWALKLPYRDLTGGFRVISRKTLESVDFRSIETIGYGFQIELAMRAFDAGLAIKEIPITFIERTRGKSKMRSWIVLEALRKTSSWAIERRLRGV
jgi:dolichol-phosphate mannosyltransferase